MLLEGVQPDGSCSSYSQIERVYVSNWIPLYCGVAAEGAQGAAGQGGVGGVGAQAAKAVAALKGSGGIYYP